TLSVEEINSPEPGDNEIVLSVKAASLNFFDTLIIERKYQYRPELPFSPAAEVSGVVKSAGANVTRFKPGDRAMAYLGWGGAREEVAVDENKAVAIPDAIDHPSASGLTVTYGTTLHALRDRADLRPGETLAILGASGGVGQAAIEIGKTMGARVIACASSDDKLEFCAQLGADELVNYANTDLKEALKQLSGGKGIDCIYDPVGGDFTEPAFRAMGWGGRYLVIGFAAGAIPKLPLNLVLLKGCQVVGVFWGEHVAREPDKHRANMQTLLDWCAAGKIRPHIHKTYSLEETVEALQAIARREINRKFTSVLIFVGYNLIFGFTQTGIDNAAHLGGFATGLLMGALLIWSQPAPGGLSRRPRYA
ncbi:MAG: rhomboid family intramembrane serine protease, partial [Pseudomonadota bacterium]